MLLAQLDLRNPDTNPIAKFKTFSSILNLVIPLLITGAALVFLVMLLMGAYRWLTGGDNPELIKKAQQTIVYSMIGLVIVIISFLVVQVIGRLFGFNSLLPL